MKRFGRQGGGGRRKAARVAVPLPAVLGTVTSSYRAAMLDVSSSGARVRGEELPSTGAEVLLKTGWVEAFGTVAWLEGNECGIHFDAPLSPNELALLRYDGDLTRFSGLTAEERMAVADWTTGLAR